MKKLRLALSILTAVFATQANAKNVEVDASIVSIIPDEGDSINSYAVGGTYFVKPLVSNGAPLHELAFVNKTSNFTARVANSSISDDVSTTALFVGGQYYIDGTKSRVAGDITRATTTVFNQDVSVSNFNLDYGYLPNNNLLLGIGLTGASTDDSTVTNLALSGKYLANNVNVEGRIVLADATTIALGADYYLDNTLSIGATLGTVSNDNASSSSFGVRAKKFFNESASVAVNASFPENGQVIRLVGAYRF